jgi:protein-S-isoprenylcysteine O-methyltransferase Ste14
MLSHDERRRLEAIERHLQCEDPDLARHLAEGTPAWPTHRVLTAVLLIFGMIGTLIGLLTATPAVLIVAGIAPVCAGWWLHHARRARHNQS